MSEVLGDAGCVFFVFFGKMVLDLYDQHISAILGVPDCPRMRCGYGMIRHECLHAYIVCVCVFVSTIYPTFAKRYRIRSVIN